MDFVTKGGQKIKYSYAPLSDVLDACRKGLSENNLAIMQPTKMREDGKLIVETLLSHSSGEWIKSEILIESQDKTPQSEGSALTYARRYALSSLLGIASEEDDDAERAMGKEDKGKQPETKLVPTTKVGVTGLATVSAEATPTETLTPSKAGEHPWMHQCPEHKVLWLIKEGIPMHIAATDEKGKNTWCLLPGLLLRKLNKLGMDTKAQIEKVWGKPYEALPLAEKCRAVEMATKEKQEEAK